MTANKAIGALISRLEDWRGSLRRDIDPIRHMFEEDVCDSVIPYGLRRGNGASGLIEGSDSERAKLLSTLRTISRNGERATSEAETVPEAVREIVQQIVWRGYAALVVGEPMRDPPRARRHAVPQAEMPEYRPLRPSPYGLTFRTPLGLFHLTGRNEWSAEPRWLRFYSRRKLLLIDAPRLLGGRWGVRLLLRKLNLFSDVFPNWSAESLFKEHQEVRFDVPRYAALRAAYHAETVGKWGWNGRDHSTTHQTEFFSVYRTLAFHITLAHLREHVVTKLNLFVKTRLGIDAQCKLQGVPTAVEIRAVRDEMVRGDISLIQALEKSAIIEAQGL